MQGQFGLDLLVKAEKNKAGQFANRRGYFIKHQLFDEQVTIELHLFFQQIYKSPYHDG
ncbi:MULTISPECIES: hypothetical protein [unclassified Legionella]|uniref:hypothetical protein n=1 Tax=unclassified Legionella TaxID=2622702 RepID=UPI001E411FC4|nr:hypothetical protein [Legionella sp. 31fI33]MCC5016092.1 hypothetical protein [Legionella sp. 31fI33]